MLKIWLMPLLILCWPMAGWAQQVPALHTQGARSGQLQLELRPTEAVQATASTLVTFGVPFPRGALGVGELSQVRASIDGAEVPIWVDMLTPWRHLADASQDGAWVRVLRVQLVWRFAQGPQASTPVVLSWNQGARTLSRTARLPTRDGWHRVNDTVTATSGPTFGPPHEVFEPDVYAVLPQSWLAKSGLKTPTLGFAAGVTGQRQDPGSVLPQYPGFEEADRAQVNFFYTIINEDERNSGATDNNTNPFSQPGAFEPWLYDRAMAMFVGYLRGGQFRMLREAVRNTDYYRRQLWRPADCSNGPCVGSFRLKNPIAADSYHDTKYSYNESLALMHWLTGDDDAALPIEDVARIHAGDPAVNRTDWTERHLAFKLMAEIVAWEYTGKAEYRERLNQTLAAFREGQLKPYGGVADGGIWHSIAAHEGVESTQPITSPWMSALIVDAAVRAALMGENLHAGPLVEGLAAHVCGLGGYRQLLTIGGNTTRALLIPHYLATLDGAGWPSEFDPISNAEHAPEAAAIAAWGAYFKARTGDANGVVTLARCARDYYATFDHVITSWTRPGTPNFDAYRVTPPRKYAWWFKNSSGFGWALAAAEGRSNLMPDPDPQAREGRVAPIRPIRDRRSLGPPGQELRPGGR